MIDEWKGRQSLLSVSVLLFRESLMRIFDKSRKIREKGRQGIGSFHIWYHNWKLKSVGLSADYISWSNHNLGFSLPPTRSRRQSHVLAVRPLHLPRAPHHLCPSHRFQWFHHFPSISSIPLSLWLWPFPVIFHGIVVLARGDSAHVDPLDQR